MTDLARLTPTVIPPLAPGETRLVFATCEEVLSDFLDFPKWDAIYQAHETVMRMSKDGEYVIDLIPLDSQVE